MNMPSAIQTPSSATPTEMPVATRKKITEIFSREEIRQLTERSDWRGLLAVTSVWATIGLTLAMLAWAREQPLWLFVPLFILGLCILGGRHLALAILHHEAAHKSLLKSPWLNDWVGEWLCARPTWNNLTKYRAHHFQHHTRTGQPDDSDLSLVSDFPVSRASLTRKLLRDLIGLTGLKYLLGLTLMDAGVIKWTLANDIVRLPQYGRRWWHYPRDFLRNSAGMWLCNGIFFGICWAAGQPWLYGVWILAYLTPYPLFLRIRSMAEHACTEQSSDMFRNTRTTRAGLLARVTVAPAHVNFHVEHHVMASVPFFRLPQMHHMLRERGAVEPASSYLQVLRIVTTPQAD